MTPATDVWALGCVLYYIYEGKDLPILEELQEADEKLFPNEQFRWHMRYMTHITQKKIYKGLFRAGSRTPKVVQNLIKRMLSLDPSKRPSAKEAAAVLEKSGAK